MACCCAPSDEEAPVRPVKPAARGCTDLPCLLLLVSVWCAFIFVCAFAFTSSFPPSLFAGYDSFGNTCGAENAAIADAPLSGMDMTDRPYLFLQDMEHPERALALCVKLCPPRQLDSIAEVNQFFAATGSQLCRYDFGGHAYDFSALVAAVEPGRPVLVECPSLPVPATSALQGRCVPQLAAGVSTQRVRAMVAALNGQPLLRQLVGDIQRCWRQVGALAGAALLLALLVVALLQLVASVVGVLLTVAAVAAVVAVTALLWWTYASLKLTLDVTPPERVLRTAAINETALLAAAVATTLLAPLLIWAVVSCWRSLRATAHVFGEAACCIYSMPCLLLQPVWTALAEALLLIMTGVTLVALGSISHTTPTTATEAGQPQRLLQRQPESWPAYAWWLVPVVAVWTAEFLQACQWLVISGSVGRWYFRRGGDSPCCTIARSVGTLVCHHLGTAALGAFLVTLLRAPRAALNWIQRQKDGATASPCCSSTCCTCTTCASCLCRCCENCVRVVTRNAYAVTALDGRPFCAAGRAALAALSGSAGAAAAVFGAAQLTLYCGRLLVTLLVSTAGLLWFRRDAELRVYAAPLLVTALAAYLLAGCVFGVLEAVAETLLLCYCQDVASAADEPDATDRGHSLPDTTDGAPLKGASRGSALHASPKLARLMVQLGAASTDQPRLRQPLYQQRPEEQTQATPAEIEQLQPLREQMKASNGQEPTHSVQHGHGQAQQPLEENNKSQIPTQQGRGDDINTDPANTSSTSFIETDL